MTDTSSPRHYNSLTRLLHADRLGGVEQGALHKPLHLAAAFNHPSASDICAVFQGEKPGHVYARQGNPTVAALEAKLCLLEEAKGAICFSTGMAAIAAVCTALLRAGDHVISSQFMFSNTNSVFQTLEGMGITVSFVDATQAGAVQAAITGATRMVFVETIANPRTQIADLAGIGQVCSQAGLLFVVDSTMTTPLLCRPADFQAGLVVHSLTKGIGGHGNAMGGAILDTGLFDWSAYPNIDPGYRKGRPDGWGLVQMRKKGLRDFGASLRSEDAHRIATGAETLGLRVPRACENALHLARWLETRPEVSHVYYPGLASHPQHERAAALFGGTFFGSLLSFELRPELNVLAFLDLLELVIVSTHLADNRTLAIPVAQTIFYELGPERRAAMGISDGLIRMSVGIEDIDDLHYDLERALDSVQG